MKNNRIIKGILHVGGENVPGCNAHKYIGLQPTFCNEHIKRNQHEHQQSWDLCGIESHFKQTTNMRKMPTRKKIEQYGKRWNRLQMYRHLREFEQQQQPKAWNEKKNLSLNKRTELIRTRGHFPSNFETEIRKCFRALN